MNAELNRRDFFAALGGGLLVFCPAGEAAIDQTTRRFSGNARPQEVSAWLHIGEDGMVTVYTGKAEMGQNIRTSLAQAAAEELHAPLASVRLVMGDTDLSPFDMGTFGSRTTPYEAPQIRKAAAVAREALVDLAAAKWAVDRASVAIAGGKASSGAHSAGFGELTRGQKIVRQIPDEVFLTPASEWEIAGHSAPKASGREIVTGKHLYASDLKRPGMLYGKVLRPPAFGAGLTSLNDDAARRLRDVTVVHEGDFAGVAAPDEETAEHALEALKAEWKRQPQPSQEKLYEYLKANAEQPAPHHPTGDHTHQAAYTVAYIAHTPLEPRAAVAEWNDGKLTVWTGSQRPFGIHGELMQAFGLNEDRVRVVVPDTGSGYGGKHPGDAAIEAARLAKAAGKPVKVVWSREEEFTWAYFRPAGLIEIASGISHDGRITSWAFDNYNSGPSGMEGKYDLPNPRIAFHESKPPLRQGSYRGLAATGNHFARETHMDELAQLVRMDPLEFRLKNIKDERQRAVAVAAADKFGWGKRRSGGGRGCGMAVGFEKGGYVATCAEIAMEGGRPKILRVVEAFECGAVVNPDHLRNQIEGAIIMAIGGALFEQIRFENGRILNPRLSQYRVPRFEDVPSIEVLMLDRKDLPSAGAGETPIVGLAPAVGNAICAATGKRLRSMPLAL